MKTHWTASSIKDYIFRIASDFIVQLDNKMEAPPLSQDALAKKIGVTKGAVSQMFNNPGNITLRRIVKYSKALNMKVAIVAYEDDDPDNKKGPINSEIFRICWEKSGKPREFWDLQGAGNEFNQLLKLAIADRGRYMVSGSAQGTSMTAPVITGHYLPVRRPTPSCQI